MTQREHLLELQLKKSFSNSKETNITPQQMLLWKTNATKAKFKTFEFHERKPKVKPKSYDRQ